MDVLFVLNAQNSFLSPDGTVYMGEKAEVLKIRLKDVLSRYSGPKIFFREIHATEDTFFTGDITHSIATTSDVQVCEDLKVYATLFYDKPRYNALYNTQIESWLKRSSIGNVGLVGVETHTSILFTAEHLRNIGYGVTVIEPCTMARDDYFHGNALALMRHFLGVRVSNE